MSLKKIPAKVAESLASVDITELSDFGKTLLSQIKSGGNIIAHAPENSGKSTAAIVACFNKVNQELEGAPRILYICGSVEDAISKHELMSKIANPLDVTVDLAHEKGDMVKQRNEIFNGTEIIVGTIRRIFDLYVQNGINIQLLDYLIFDDFEDILTQGKIMEVKRLIDGMNKTQTICLINQSNQRVEQFMQSTNMQYKLLEL